MTASRHVSPNKVNARIVETTEVTSSYRYCWYPTVHRFPTGELLVTMRMTPDDTMPEGEFSAYCVSRDRGRTWSRRYPMGAGANVDAAYTKQPRPDGSIWSLGGGYCVTEPVPGSDGKAFYVTLTKFTRAGMRVEQVRDAIIRVNELPHMDPVRRAEANAKDAAPLAEVAQVVPFGSIIEALDGSLLVSLYYQVRATDRRKVVLARATDDGMTWEEYSTVAALAPGQPEWVGGEGPNESDIVRLKDQRLYVVFRTAGNGYIGHAWSHDEGRTWSAPLSAGFKGVCPHLARLTNGMLALSTGRPDPVGVRFSPKGDGTDWTSPLDIFGGQDAGGHGLNRRKSTRYTDLLELEPGRLIVVYDSVPYGWDPIPESDKTAKNAILATIVGYGD